MISSRMLQNVKVATAIIQTNEISSSSRFFFLVVNLISKLLNKNKKEPHLYYKSEIQIMCYNEPIIGIYNRLNLRLTIHYLWLLGLWYKYKIWLGHKVGRA